MDDCNAPGDFQALPKIPAYLDWDDENARHCRAFP
jgi:hypothetical protein